MMKKSKISFFLIFLLMYGAAPVYAQETSLTPPQNTTQQVQAPLSEQPDQSAAHRRFVTWVIAGTGMLSVTAIIGGAIYKLLRNEHWSNPEGHFEKL